MENIKNKLTPLVLIVVFAAFNFWPHVSTWAADDAGDIKDDISDLEKKANKVEQQLQETQSQLYKNQIQVNATKNVISKTSEEITRKEKELDNLSSRLDLNKTILAEYIRQMYFESQENLVVKLAVASGNLDDFIAGFDTSISIKTRILDIVEEINGTKTEIEKTKINLAEKKKEHEKVLAVKKVEQNEIYGDIQEKKATLAEIQQKLSELRSDLNRILGKSYDTGEIKDAIRFASKQTGVRKGFLFGMLSMESGGNPLAGNCTYKNCDMRSDRKKKFKEICDGLDFSNNKCEKMPLSCASKSYPGSGGAMGAAQFMSDTWMGYKNRIADAIGHNPPDPWGLLDGVVAMALYLDDLGATNDGKVSIKNPCNGKSVRVKWEIYASMRYLGWTCYGYTNYAPGVQSLASGYDDL